MVLDLMKQFPLQNIHYLQLEEIEEIMVELLMEQLVMYYTDGGEIEPAFSIKVDG